MVNQDHQEYDPGLVMLCLGFAFLGAYLAICMVEQLRSSCLTQINNSLFNRVKWYILIGISLGGIGAAGMQYMALSAMRLVSEIDGERIRLKFDIIVSVSALSFANIGIGLGTYICSHDRLFAKHKYEILDMFIEDTSNLSMSQIMKMKDWMIIRVMCTKELGPLLLGGFVAGSGISIMHYIAMTSMIYPGYIEWDGGIILSSILIAIIAATVSFWILFRVLSVFPRRESLRVISALIMTASICGMHFAGMAAVNLVNTGKIKSELTGVVISQDGGRIPLIIALMATCWVLAMIVFADMRDMNHQYRLVLRKKNMLPTNSSYRSAQSSKASNRFDALMKHTHSSASTTAILAASNSSDSLQSKFPSIALPIAGRSMRKPTVEVAVHSSSRSILTKEDSLKDGHEWSMKTDSSFSMTTALYSKIYPINTTHIEDIEEEGGVKNQMNNGAKEVDNDDNDEEEEEEEDAYPFPPQTRAVTSPLASSARYRSYSSSNFHQQPLEEEGSTILYSPINSVKDPRTGEDLHDLEAPLIQPHQVSTKSIRSPTNEHGGGNDDGGRSNTILPMIKPTPSHQYEIPT